jgi:GNAT superfamily N-acetyltransferase
MMTASPARPAAGRSAVPATDWLCSGGVCWRGSSPGCGVASRLVDRLSGITTRVGVQRWVRYRVDLDRVAPPPDDVRLTPLTGELVARLRTHPDHAQEAFASGLEFWTLGARGGFVWYEDGEPLCFQWLLGDADIAALRARSPWASMYPPLAGHTAQLEKLWTFSTARKRGVASRFALAMFDEAKRRGFRRLITHIHETNDAARSWAQKTGWSAYGTIVRYTLDAPVARECNMNVCAHRCDA